MVTSVKKKKTVKIDLFHLSFIGEFCELLCDFHGAMEGIPAVIQGYILDKDTKYYYVSDDAKEITKAVKINTVRYIEIVKNKTWKDRALEEIPHPEKEEDIN